MCASLNSEIILLNLTRMLGYQGRRAVEGTSINYLLLHVIDTVKISFDEQSLYDESLS